MIDPSQARVGALVVYWPQGVPSRVGRIEQVDESGIGVRFEDGSLLTLPSSDLEIVTSERRHYRKSP